MRYRGRKGITLLEVLVSIFIMGVGMIALLTLFPLGAINMARALQDDRASQAANQAAEMALVKELRHDPLLGAPFSANDVFLNPAPGFAVRVTSTGVSRGPSFPVLVDPYGVTLGSNYLGQVLTPRPGFTRTGGIPRVSASYVTTPQSVNRWFSLQDDMEFAEDATPAQPFKKGGRYTWSYLLRRPRAFEDGVVDLWVIVYAGRDTQSVPPTGEDVYPAVGARGTSTVQLTYGTPAVPNKPATRKGTWILDVTADASGVTQGNFYRVVNVSDAGPNPNNPPGGNLLALEVDPPLKADMTVAVVMENVIDVFEKGSSWLP